MEFHPDAWADMEAWNKKNGTNFGPNNPTGAASPAGAAGTGGGTFTLAPKPYNANAPVYGSMPRQATFPAFQPGAQQQLAEQMQAGFGGGVPGYMEHMNQIYRPSRLTQLFEPLTQTARTFGLEHTGQPGGWKAGAGGANPQNYQQYGMQSGSPFIDALFGMQANVPPAPAPGTTPPVVPPTPTPPPAAPNGTQPPYQGPYGSWFNSNL